MDADTGIVVFTGTTIWRDGIFSFVFSNEKLLILMVDAVVRHECYTQSDFGQVYEQIVTA
mgnify:CR=1 FL=1